MYNSGGDVYDIGSIADLWTGVKSRKWLKKILK
jgi:hypothetical protein